MIHSLANQKNKITQRCVVGIFSVFAWTQFSFAKSNESEDWLAFERPAPLSHFDAKSKSRRLYDDRTDVVVSTARDLRMMIDGAENSSSNSVENLETTVEINAEHWFASLPNNVDQPKFAKNSQASECKFNVVDNVYECQSVKINIFGVAVKSTQEPQILVIAPSAQKLEHVSEDVLAENEIYLEKSSAENQYSSMIPSVSPNSKSEKSLADSKNSVQVKESNDIRLFKGAAGIVTTTGGKIVFDSIDSIKKIILTPDVKKSHVSMFIRDPSIATVDLVSMTLKAHIEGATEMFVVSKDRISIIPVKVTVSALAVAAVALPSDTSSKAVASNAQGTSRLLPAPQLSVPESLVSLDSLDKAASGMRSSYTNSESDKNSALGLKPVDSLKVPDELMETDDDSNLSNDLKNVSFAHGKSAARFNKMFVRLIDERSSWSGNVVYPVGGLTLRMIGTEFEAKSDGQGYIEIPDVPVGSRILAEVIDQNGATMPGFFELVPDISTTKKSSAQVVMVRRYLSLEYAARLAGVVPNMQQSSICATIVKSTQDKTPVSGQRVTTAMAGIGPFYFGDLGYIDTRLSSTGRSGRFCYFNVDSGPATFGIYSKDFQVSGQSSEAQHSVVLLTAVGRHSEELIGLEDARHLTTSMASIPTAAEQLSSDAQVSNRYLPVEYADIAALGHADPMISIDEGVFTTANPVIPIRGRIWTVTNSSDYEPSIQATSIKLPGHRQITSLIPRGFVDDMTHYAQTTQENSQGTIVVEHAAVSGQGTESVKIKLVDSSGKEAGEGWYFSDLPIAKAVFFNVPQGVYTVVVETASGHWLTADTAVSYEEMSTFVRTGAPLEKKLLRNSVQN
ncbi:MAG: hypothetical protein NT027_08340 [Proteobacteria bacterium]|nr:hypothetical protein [Pseudomonadota bacterium]